MNLTLKHAAATIILMLSLAAPLVAGPLEDGYSAYTRGDFVTAMRIMRPLAEQGHATAQTVVGLMHYFNYGDYVAHTCGSAWRRHRATLSRKCF